MFRRINLAASITLLFLATPRFVFAASPDQAGTFDPFADPAMAFGIIFIGTLVAVVVGGIVIALLARPITTFFGKNVPSDAAMAAFEKSQSAAMETARTAPRRPITISPNWEPFIIALGGFVVVYALTSFLVTPPAPKGEVTPATTPVASSGLATTGDFTKIVASLPKGNPDNGAKIFSSAGCVGCHSQVKDERKVGPSFYGLFSRAGTRVPNMGAKEYIYQSIVAPNAYIVESYQSGLMPQTFAKSLSQQDVADLLAWIERDHNQQ